LAESIENYNVNNAGNPRASALDLIHLFRLKFAFKTLLLLGLLESV